MSSTTIFSYRVTLCVSAFFAVARCTSGRLSVRLTVSTSRWCIVSRRLKISSNFFLGPIILDFLIPSADTQFQGDPFSRGGKYTEGGEICNFRLKSPFISETVRDRSIVAMDFNSKS